MQHGVDVAHRPDGEAAFTGRAAVAQQRGVELVEHHRVERLELHRAEPRNDVQPHDPRVARVGAGADGRLDRRQPPMHEVVAET